MLFTLRKTAPLRHKKMAVDSAFWVVSSKSVSRSTSSWRAYSKKEKPKQFRNLSQEFAQFRRGLTNLDKFSLTLYSSRSALRISGSITWMSSNISLSITTAVDLLCGNNHTRVREIKLLSWGHRFQKAPFSKCFPSTWERKPGVFKFLWFEKRFWNVLFSCRISLDGRPNR